MPPSVVLLCHDDDPIDREGLAAWLASSFRLVGLLLIRDRSARRLRAVRREYRRSGVDGLADVFGFQLFYRLAVAGRDEAWRRAEASRLSRLYAANLDAVPIEVVSDPNSEEARRFLTALHPDLMIARCKFILNRSVFSIPRVGTFAIHPGVCPEYRNAHGCFWALTRRDLGRVGMTLLRIDAGVDTGPVYLRASYPFDELAESHVVIQYRVVTENLPIIARTLTEIAEGRAQPLCSAGRASAVWGHPRLSAYWKWKKAARHDRDDLRHLTAVP
jgi:folate-dependent phosphoribosylglycinamide formyltransferase PurN